MTRTLPCGFNSLPVSHRGRNRLLNHCQQGRYAHTLTSHRHTHTHTPAKQTPLSLGSVSLRLCLMSSGVTPRHLTSLLSLRPRAGIWRPCRVPPRLNAQQTGLAAKPPTAPSVPDHRRNLCEGSSSFRILRFVSFCTSSNIAYSFLPFSLLHFSNFPHFHFGNLHRRTSSN